MLSGFSTFIPKFIANQFGTKASWAAMLTGNGAICTLVDFVLQCSTGFIAVPGAAIGQFLGGYILRRLKLKVRGMLKMNMIFCIIVMVSSSVFWVHCDLGSIAGVTAAYNKNG